MTVQTYAVRYEIPGSDGPAVFEVHVQAASFADAEQHVEALKRTATIDGVLMEHKLTATEALYGFVGWLTSRDEPVTFSAVHGATEAADLVAKFICENELADVSREDWYKFLNHPKVAA